MSRTGRPLPADRPVAVASAADPVAAFRSARDEGRAVALSTSATAGSARNGTPRLTARPTASGSSNSPRTDRGTSRHAPKIRLSSRQQFMLIDVDVEIASVFPAGFSMMRFK